MPAIKTTCLIFDSEDYEDVIHDSFIGRNPRPSERSSRKSVIEQPAIERSERAFYCRLSRRARYEELKKGCARTGAEVRRSISLQKKQRTTEDPNTLSLTNRRLWSKLFRLVSGS